MSKLLDLADKGDAATARFAEQHLKQTPEAKEKRQRNKERLIKWGKVTLTAVAVVGLYKGVDLLLDTADAQAQYVQEVGNEYVNQPQDGGIDRLEP